VSRAIEHAGASRPFFRRTGPAWVFGILGVIAEMMLAPMVLMLTFAVGLVCYLLLDTPRSKIRAQQRPRFMSVRILYLNTLIVAGFWLAVMFTFSAADPAVSNGVEQRLPALLDVATARDLGSMITMKHAAMIKPVTGPVVASTWFDVFLHGVICSLALNFLLYGIVIARRRQQSMQSRRASIRGTLRYDALVGLFVNEDSAATR
jgi:hypothetical protein